MFRYDHPQVLSASVALSRLRSAVTSCVWSGGCSEGPVHFGNGRRVEGDSAFNRAVAPYTKYDFVSCQLAVRLKKVNSGKLPLQFWLLSLVAVSHRVLCTCRAALRCGRVTTAVPSSSTNMSASAKHGRCNSSEFVGLRHRICVIIHAEKQSVNHCPWPFCIST